MIKISIAKNFSKYPGGRYIEDGPDSGQEFREEHLAPLLKENNQVQVDLDGTRGYGSSFLEEVFGGLIREEGFNSSILDELLTIISTDDALLDEIESYINDAEDFTG